MKKLALLSVAALAGCQTLPVGSQAPTPENIALSILAWCNYTVPIADIIAFKNANNVGLQTADAIGKAICQTAMNVINANLPPASSARGLVAVPFAQPPLVIQYGGTTIHLKPA